MQVPNMAANPLNPKKKMVSKSFHRSVTAGTSLPPATSGPAVGSFFFLGGLGECRCGRWRWLLLLLHNLWLPRVAVSALLQAFTPVEATV